MDPRSLQTPSAIDGARDNIGGEHVCAIRIRISQKVCERYRGEGVVVGEGGFVEFNHCQSVVYIWRIWPAVGIGGGVVNKGMAR